MLINRLTSGVLKGGMRQDGHRRLESELRQHQTPAFLRHFSVPERKIATITFLAASLKNLIRIYKPIVFANQIFCRETVIRQQAKYIKPSTVISRFYSTLGKTVLDRRLTSKTIY